MSDKTKIEVGKLSDFKPTKVNSNKHTAKGLSALDKSMSEDGYVAPITVAADGEVLDGDARLERAFEKFGDKAIIVRHDGKTPVVMVREDIPNANDATARRIHYRANMVHWLDFSLDPAVVMADMESGFDFEAIGVSLEELGEMLEGGVEELLKGDSGDTPAPQTQEQAYQSLAERFGVPPFSVLDARQGYWQERKRAWLALGIQSELGRGENLQGERERVVKMAMYNDPMQRKRKYDAGATPEPLDKT